MLNLHYPSRWEMKRLGTLFSDNHLLNEDLRSLNALQFKYGDIIRKKKVDIDDDLLATWRHYTLVQKDDIMINGLNLNYDFVSKRVAIVREEGIITSAYISLRPIPAINARYYCYLLKAIDEHKILHGMGTGIRLTLSFSQLRNYHLPVPSREEQDQIVRYLDWQISKINRLIAAKKKEIEQLKDLLQIKINDSVTRGIHTLQFRKSRADWLSEIPAHWEERKLKFLFNERSEKGYPDEPMLVASQNMGVVPKNVYGNRTVLALKDLHLLKLVKIGDFVISLRSFQGGIEYAYYQGIISPAYTIMIPGPEIITPYFKYLFKSKSFIALLKLCVTGIREGQNIDYGLLRNKYVPLPPATEQKEIAEGLDKFSERVRLLIAQNEKEIDFLIELKTRLISDVVTGQIDVRGVEIPQFNIVDEQIIMAEAAEEEAEEEMEECDGLH